MKKITLITALLFCTLMTFAQKAQKTFTLQEGENTVLLTKNSFTIVVADGIIESVSEKGNAFSAFSQDDSVLEEKLDLIKKSVDTSAEGVVWEKGKELLIIVLEKGEDGYSGHFYLFEI